ncbi:hypothetical protein, partial [uncultured Thiodictyon sp.]|uniref:hypothetical protein n=1 Tax=uncultured Thiodictyon sp. TaxID=1846217 RepID=UPI0025FF2F39
TPLAQSARASLAARLAPRRPGWYRLHLAGRPTLARLPERHQQDAEDAHERGLCRARVDFVDEPGHPCHGSRCTRPAVALRQDALVGDYAFVGRAGVSGVKRARDPEAAPPYVRRINAYLFECREVKGVPGLLIEPDTTRPLSALNDARSTGRAANARAVDLVHTDGRRTVAIFTLEPVSAVDELTIDYGKYYWKFHAAMAAEWAKELGRRPGGAMLVTAPP